MATWTTKRPSLFADLDVWVNGPTLSNYEYVYRHFQYNFINTQPRPYKYEYIMVQDARTSMQYLWTKAL